ncbi:molybdate transport system substrate-binding protein [Roseovarius azorensis]|uniref:Molybdate transport system substrate-binding protein n=1 Tax=Roseovarius azorensis TaxID=1287727 RepID=A0A1H7NB25_9RHOB|nr:molybdate ABC transporter substrate-binding protein [Roseovarius azorensis]SEL20664.1 molybdate transport system substrate-binding protein [Roseovarius azorensis]
MRTIRSIRQALGAAFCALAMFAPVRASAEEITVFAAASLATALSDIAAQFEAATDHRLSLSFAGSSALARQIQQGAPADILVSASPDWMDVLEQDGLIESGTRVDLLGNSIVLIAHGAGAEPIRIGPGTDLTGLLGGGRLAMALVDAVPAGIYGKAALENLGLWTSVSGQVAQTDNVRAALALVAIGEAPYGIVYATDAVAEDRVTVVATFPAESYPPVIYPLADLANRDVPAEAEFVDFLRGPQARATFERQGFVVLAE